MTRWRLRWVFKWVLAILMGTNARPSRRQLLVAGATALLLDWRLADAAGRAPETAPVKSGDPTRLLTAWDDEQGRHHVGILRVGGSQCAVQSSVEVPTRAHALAIEPDGAVLAVARRPGDWLLRWRPGRSRINGRQWWWNTGAQRFNGHLLPTADGQYLLTTETDMNSGAGLLVRRDRASLDVIAQWPTLGQDPHALLLLPQGHALVANGGIATLPETGRAKHNLAQMDSSLAIIDPANGKLLGQWRLQDPRLSLRHLALHPGGRVAVALQAEHDDPVEKARAPVLALFDPEGGKLDVAPESGQLEGYAGDVAVINGRFVVGCSRAGQAVHFSVDGKRAGSTALVAPCAVAPTRRGAGGWVTGKDAVVRADDSCPVAHVAPTLQLDNHAIAI